MSRTSLGIGLLSATALSAGAINTADAATNDTTLRADVDSYGVVTISGMDIADFMTEEEIGVGEMYAGNNCVCLNSNCADIQV